jgi:hypothetical protein
MQKSLKTPQDTGTYFNKFLDHLSRRYHAEVDWAAFEDLYRRRADGEDIKMSRDLQRNFQAPASEVQKRTAGYIAQYLKANRAEWENEIFLQRRRLTAAQESLAKKETKKAREDIRIATSKVQGLLDRLTDLRRAEPNNEDARIFPMMHAPLLLVEDGKSRTRDIGSRLASEPPHANRRSALDPVAGGCSKSRTCHAPTWSLGHSGSASQVERPFLRASSLIPAYKLLSHPVRIIFAVTMTGRTAGEKNCDIRPWSKRYVLDRSTNDPNGKGRPQMSAPACAPACLLLPCPRGMRTT